MDEREARALLAKAARSSGGLVAVARAHGVDGRSLNAWRYNLAQGANATAPRKAPPRRPRLVELVPTAVVELPAIVGSGRYTLRIGGVELEFGDEARVDTLRRVVEVLRSC
jgi:transposase-like protein